MSKTLQRGQAIILVAVMVGVVVGMAALAIDGSRAYALRRDMQNAVDYAALAAADSYQRFSSYSTAESTAATNFGVQMRLYAAPSCTSFGAPGPGTWTVTCTYSDGTTLVETMPVRGPQGAQFTLTATQTLSLQFGRILTNGTSPQISSTGASRVNNLLYSPTIAALDQAGCGGAGGTAITIFGSGQLQVLGDVVSNGTVSVGSGTGVVAGDVYSRCQSTISGITMNCYSGGGAQPCTYPDVAGVIRSGTHFVDPGYPAPTGIGGAQATPGANVNLASGVYSALVSLAGSKCYFLGGGVYQFSAGFVNTSALVSNELKPPDEPNPSNNTVLASPQFWDVTGTGCAGSAQYQAINCNSGNGNCGGGNCGQGVGQGNGCTSAPQGTWAFEVTSVRTDTLNGNTYVRESAPSTCQTAIVGNHQAVQLTVSNVPGATSYNVYAALPGSGCAGPFGLAENLPVSVSVLNNALGGCPAFTGTTCSLGFEGIILNGNDIGSPFAPNAGAAADTVGAYPPSSEIAALAAGLPNQNPPRAAGSGGDRANENNCEAVGGTFATCPTAVTPGAVEFYLPGSCLTTTNTSDTYVFSGYQYDWVALYQPAGNTCPNFFGSDVNSAFVGLVYMPGASFNNISNSTFEVAGTGGIIADTLSFTGGLPAISFSSSYAPVPFAARLVS